MSRLSSGKLVRFSGNVGAFIMMKRMVTWESLKRKFELSTSSNRNVSLLGAWSNGNKI